MASKITIDKITQNLRLMKIMKSSGYTDSEIASYLGISTREFLEAIEEEEYLKSVYEAASETLASELEAEFLKKVFSNLDAGKTEDAKWVLERTSKKYQKKDQVELNIKSIDEIIKENT